MKVDVPKQPRTGRVRVLISQMTDKGKVVGLRSGYGKGKHITLCDTTVDEVYNICLKALEEQSKD